MPIELTQEIANECRFPAADLASDHSKPGTVHHAKFKHGKRQAVSVAPIDQIRVG